MSYRVAVVCEDHRLDQYILRPVLESLLAKLGKPRARVTAVTNPQLTGFSTLLTRLCEVVERYDGVVDLVVIASDTDCDDGIDGRRDKCAQLRNRLDSCRLMRANVVVVCAIQEIEVWALWGARANLPAWNVVRGDCDPKETYLNGFLTKADLKRADRGRSRLVEASLSTGWDSLAQGCPELQTLEDDVRAIVA
jgi:hypothetical protein